MMYTKEEYENTLIPNGRAIENFIKTEIQPFLAKDVKINFGDIVRRGRYSEIRENKFTLYVSKERIHGACGGLSMHFDIPYYLKNSTGSIDIWNSCGYGGEFLYDLCHEWQSIKSQLLREVESQKASRDSVLKNFTV